MNAAPSITDTLSSMIGQSMQLLSKPSVQTFEQLEDKGKVREAVIYVAAGSVITGLLGLGAGLGGFIAGILTTIIGFLVFTYLIFYIGKARAVRAASTRWPTVSRCFTCPSRWWRQSGA